MSELLDKQANAQKRKAFKLLQAHVKVCNENDTETKKKQQACKMLLMEGSPL